MYYPSLNTTQTILCLGAHSDDIEIGCGGTILELIDANPSIDIHWVVLSGDEQRAQEAQAGAERFLGRDTGRHQVHLKSFRDSYFPAQWEQIKDWFHELSQKVQPDLVFTHRRDDMHQDHRVVSELTWCTFRNHLVLEYEIAKYEGDLGQPNVLIPVSQTNAQSKIDLLMDCFGSQRSKAWFDDETFRAMLRLRGLESNSASGYAEAFHCRKMCLGIGLAEDGAGTTGRSPAREMVSQTN